jgi:head-tail adaptor
MDRIELTSLRDRLTVWRASLVDDGQGGEEETYAQVGEVWAKVSQPSVSERTIAAQSGARLTHPVHLLPDADVRRLDELRDSAGTVFRVVSTVRPSTPTYLRADCERDQSEGDTA